MDLSKEIELQVIETEEQRSNEPSKVVVRLTTSTWHDLNGVHIRKSLKYLRRKSQGENFVHEDCTCVGALDVVTRIINLDECKDGVYEIVTCNEHGSWETPHIIEDYDYKLVPI